MLCVPIVVSNGNGIHRMVESLQAGGNCSGKCPNLNPTTKTLEPTCAAAGCGQLPGHAPAPQSPLLGKLNNQEPQPSLVDARLISNGTTTTPRCVDDPSIFVLLF
jgi:hypothetical protein